MSDTYDCDEPIFQDDEAGCGPALIETHGPRKPSFADSPMWANFDRLDTLIRERGLAGDTSDEILPLPKLEFEPPCYCEASWYLPSMEGICDCPKCVASR